LKYLSIGKFKKPLIYSESEFQEMLEKGKQVFSNFQIDSDVESLIIV
jgi:archaeosine-15-forming tRNA-guanine transglycosylase